MNEDPPAESFRKDFARETPPFGFLAKEGRAEELAKAGNTIDVEGSKARATSSAKTQEMFDRLSTRSGPITDILTEGARRPASGERIAAIKSDIGAQLRAAIEATVKSGLAKGGAGGDRGIQLGNVKAPHEQGTDASTATGSSAPNSPAEGEWRVAESTDETRSPPDIWTQGGLLLVQGEPQAALRRAGGYGLGPEAPQCAGRVQRPASHQDQQRPKGWLHDRDPTSRPLLVPDLQRCTCSSHIPPANSLFFA